MKEFYPFDNRTKLDDYLASSSPVDHELAWQLCCSGEFSVEEFFPKMAYYLFFCNHFARLSKGKNPKTGALAIGSIGLEIQHPSVDSWDYLSYHVKLGVFDSSSMTNATLFLKHKSSLPELMQYHKKQDDARWQWRMSARKNINASHLADPEKTHQERYNDYKTALVEFVNCLAKTVCNIVKEHSYLIAIYFAQKQKEQLEQHEQSNS